MTCLHCWRSCFILVGLEKQNRSSQIFRIGRNDPFPDVLNKNRSLRISLILQWESCSVEVSFWGLQGYIHEQKNTCQCELVLPRQIISLGTNTGLVLYLQGCKKKDLSLIWANISKCSLEVSHIREEKGSICVAPQSYTIALPPLTKLKETGENTELYQYWALCLAWDYLSLPYFRNNCFSSPFLAFHVGFFLIRHHFAFPWNPSLSLIVPLTPNIICICIYCIYKELKHFLLLISF